MVFLTACTGSFLLRLTAVCLVSVINLACFGFPAPVCVMPTTLVLSSLYVRVVVSSLGKGLISFLFLYRRITQRKFLFEIASREVVSSGRSGQCIFFFSEECVVTLVMFHFFMTTNLKHLGM